MEMKRKITTTNVSSQYTESVLKILSKYTIRDSNFQVFRIPCYSYTKILKQLITSLHHNQNTITKLCGDEEMNNTQYNIIYTYYRQIQQM